MKSWKSSFLAPLRWSFGRRFTQPFYSRLHRLALAGMNCGLGGAIDTSGEREVMRRLRRLWNPFDSLTFFDIGANDGAYAETLANSFNDFPNLRIFALEPSPMTFARLEKRLTRPIREKRIIPLSLALGDQEQSQELYSTGSQESSGLTSLYQRRMEHHQLVMSREATVRVATLDRFCEEQAVSRIHFLKMDIEGHELAALRGASGLLAQGNIDVLQFEFGGCNIDSRTYWQDFFYLLSPRYKLYRILRDGLQPIPTYQETDEIFITTNFLAALPSYHAALLRN